MFSGDLPGPKTIVSFGTLTVVLRVVSSCLVGGSSRESPGNRSTQSEPAVMLQPFLNAGFQAGRCCDISNCQVIQNRHEGGRRLLHFAR